MRAVKFSKIIIGLRQKILWMSAKKEVNINELGVGRWSKALDGFFDSRLRNEQIFKKVNQQIFSLKSILFTNFYFTEKCGRPIIKIDQNFIAY